MSESSPRRKLTKEHIEILAKARLKSGLSEESITKMSESHLGSKNKAAVIDEEKAFKIKSLLVKGDKIINISKELNINYAIIKSILQCKVWNHIVVEGWDDFIEEYQSKKKKLITSEQVRTIRMLISKRYTAEKISEITKIGISVIYGVKQNRTYKNVK